MSTVRESLISPSDNDASGGSLSSWRAIMPNVIKWKRPWVILLIVGVVLLLFYGLAVVNVKGTFKISPLSQESTHKGYDVWPEFEGTPPISSFTFRTTCVRNGEYSITGLVDIKTQWARSRDRACQRLYDKFSSIFTLEARKAPLDIPKPFLSKVRHWLGDDDTLMKEVYNQDVIHVISEYTREHTIFNPLRDKRPVLPPEEDEGKYYKDLLKSTAQSCDFCKFKNFTAEHPFGRVVSKHAFSASNIFKVDTLHGLLALKKHDPLGWTLEEFLDLFSLTKIWLKKAHVHYPDARFPALIWDVLPKCGASQVHPHMHVVLDSERYHGEVEAWREGAQDYFKEHQANYFSDVVAVYSALNLTVTYGKAVAFASLVPKKDHEVVVMAQEADDDFFTLLYFVLKGFVDDLHKKCFSMGMGLPALNSAEGKLPAYARVITRGFVTDLRTDMSSLELFMATNVNIDPYKTIEIVRNSVRQRSGESRNG